MARGTAGRGAAGFRRGNAQQRSLVGTMSQYYSAGYRPAFGGGTVRQVTTGGGTRVVGGTAKS